MVRLERLVLQGFKSFKRKTAIPFPAGFSVITGPNGSGKSNIGDSISFIIGKPSARSLRAKKGQELIFHGGKKKDAAEWAKVALFFDNSNKEFPFDDPVVSVSRRVNPAGISTYRLNGKIATRQQVMDVLVQVGLRPEGHNIIQQGDVNQIVEMDAVERRQIIDEISGIAEYDDKKDKAQKELGAVMEKVKEAEIILNEKQNIMDKLRAERDAALEWKGLQVDLEKIRTVLIMRDREAAQQDATELAERLAQKETETKGLEQNVRDLDEKIKKGEELFEGITKNLLQASEHLETAKRAVFVRSDLEMKKSRLAANLREIDRLGSFVQRVNLFERNPAIEAVKGFKGVHGTVEELIVVPNEYRIAFDVAAGGHSRDVVVDKMSTAVSCIKHLKEKRIGRVRFLPLDRIRPNQKKQLPSGALGWLSDLVHSDPQFTPIVNWLLNSTACVKDIDRAKSIAAGDLKFRIVTTDGDLIEQSGAMTGGYYFRKKQQQTDTKEFSGEIADLKKENEKLGIEIKSLREDLEILAEKEKRGKSFSIEMSKVRLDESLKKMRDDRREAYEKRLLLQEEIGRLNISKTRVDMRLESLVLHIEQGQEKDLEPFIHQGSPVLKKRDKEATERLAAIGAVNMKAIEDFDSLKGDFEGFREKVERIVSEKNAIESTIKEIETKRLETFNHTLNGIVGNFEEVYKELTGGQAQLELEKQGDVNSGLMIKASPPGKKLLHLDSMSGGEKTLTAFAFLFAVQRHKPAPFYLLDEADAALDKVNTQRVVHLIKKQSKMAQFILISHNDDMVREADQVYGITMEDGESKVIGVKLPEA